MKRIISLDFLRGFAIFGMIAVHVPLHTSWWAQRGNIDEILDFGPVMVGPFLAVFLLGSFRGAFLLISMIVHTFSMNEYLKRGLSPKSVLKKQLFFGFLLYIVGIFNVAITDNLGVIGQSMDAGVWRWDRINNLFRAETLQSIAISIILISIIYYLLTINGGARKIRRNVLILAIIGITFVALETLILDMLNAAYAGNYYELITGLNNSAQFQFVNIGDFFLKLFLAMIGGKEQPLFPFMGTACLGAILGIYFSQEHVPQDLPKKGYIGGIILIFIGGMILAITAILTNFGHGDYAAVLSITPHQTWLYLVLLGMQVLVLVFFLDHFEFNPKSNMQQYMKWTRWFRRWSMVALTIYVWQIEIEFPLRLLAQTLTGIDFHTRGGVEDVLPEVLMIAAVVFVWDIIIRLWEKGKLIGTFEWSMGTLQQYVLLGFQRGKVEKAERLNVRKVLYDPEPVLFSR